MVFKFGTENVNVGADGEFHMESKNAVTGNYESYQSVQGVKPYNVLRVEVIYLGRNIRLE
jgi:hypothetical protein